MPRTESPRPDAESGFSFTESRLLQQRLIDARATLDRQVGQLKRLNQFSNRLLTQADDRSLTTLFAEAIVDILDIECGAAWLLDRGGAVTDMAVWGAPDGRLDAGAGPRLREHLAQFRSQGVRLDGSAQQRFFGDGFAMSAIAQGGGVDAKSVVLFGANTAAQDGIYGPITDEMVTLLVALADKCAARLSSVRSQNIIEAQLDSIRRSEERLQLVLQSTDEGWWDWDLRSDSCLYSAHWCEMLGARISGAYASGPFWWDQMPEGDRARFDGLLVSSGTADRAGRFELEMRIRRTDGTWMPIMARAIVHRDSSGGLVRVAGSIQDLSERKQTEEHIHRLAYFDALTGLPNRRLFEARLASAIEGSRISGNRFAVLMIDIDRFKQLNDSHGHDAGDELLKALGQRLQESVRGDDTVTRVGGDEFAILLQGVGTDELQASEQALRLGDKLLAEVAKPVYFTFGARHFSCSIGVAVSNADSTTMSTLKNADVALYQAKEAGRNCVRLFDPDMQARVEWQAGMEQRLVVALEEGAFSVRYQPLADRHGGVAGVEALLRCRTSDESSFSPAEFIPVAQESGLIHRLGAFAIREALQQYRRWHDAGTLPPGLRVSVNVSAPEFLREDFPSRVLSELRQAGVPGTAVCLEITEATVVRDLDVAAARMQTLCDQGVEFSLDDFGTGFASLAYLRHLPISEVKIDRSYVQKMLVDAHDRALASAVIHLCKELDMRVVAEGVETLEQYAMLCALGCDRFQGFLFGKAVDAVADPREFIVGEIPLSVKQG